MPINAISILGFLPEAEAVAYLDNTVVPVAGETSHARWQAARAGLAPTRATAGQPAMTPLPATATSYIAGMKANNPRFSTTVRAFAHEFCTVDAQDLLAIQRHVLVPRSEAYVQPLNQGTPTMNQALVLCLPDSVRSWSQNGTIRSGDERNGGVVITAMISTFG